MEKVHSCQRFLMMFPLFRLCAQNISGKEISSMTQPLTCTSQNKLYLNSVTTIMRKLVLNAAIFLFELQQSQSFPGARSLSTGSAPCNQPLIEEPLSCSMSADVLLVALKLNCEALR